MAGFQDASGIPPAPNPGFRGSAEGGAVCLENLQSLLHVASDLLFVLDEEGRILEVGRQAHQSLDFPREELLGRPFADFIVPPRREEFRVALGEDPLLPMNRFPLVCRDGAPLEMELHLSRGSWDGKQALFVAARDLRERLRAEAQANLYIREIERTNRELAAAHARIDADMAKAARLHGKLLPQSHPPFPGLDLWAFYQPAERLGGDFYQILPFRNQLLVYVVDVSGHGLDGALLSLFVREWVLAYLERLGPEDRPLEPEALVGFVAEQFAREPLPEEYFLCLQVLAVDLTRGVARLANAGSHVRPLWSGPGRRARYLDCVGAPVAGLPGALHLQALRVAFCPGERILLCTDGLVEERAEGIFYGTDRLLRRFEETLTLSARQTVEAILVDFESFAGRRRGRDDLTLLCVKREA